MTCPYSLRLLCICLASFFLVDLAAGLAVSLVAPAAVRMAEKVRARRAAGVLLALRLLPAGLAAFVVVGLCVPSYLWLEPEAAAEEVGLVCLAAALLGAAVWGISIARGLRAVARSRRYFRRCRSGRHISLPDESTPAWVVDGAAPLLALAGITHPQVVISRPVVATLSTEQLAVAVRHERAHRAAHDNLKRLLVLLAPGLLPFFTGFGALERAWAKAVEWAADDHAVAGDARRSLALASALVQLVRLGGAEQPPALAAPFLSGGQDLRARVDRLLRLAPRAETPDRRAPMVMASVTAALAGALAATVLQPATFYSVHGVLERLVR